MDISAPRVRHHDLRLSRRVSIPALATVPAAAGALWAVLLAAWGLGLHRRLAVPAYDTAYFQQLVWGITHGHVFRASFLGGSFLGLHFSPILVLPALVELVLPGAGTLTVLSAISLGLAVPAAYLALRAILPEGHTSQLLAAALAVALPLSPPLQEAAWSGFHPEILALPALLFATWAALTDRRLLASALAVLALACKEEVAYQAAVVGLLLVVAGGTPLRRRFGVWLLALATAWGALVFFVVMPFLRDGQATDTASYFAWLRSARVSEITGALVAPRALGVLVATLLALGLLPLLRPGFALLAVPPFVAAILSRHHSQALLQLQYGLPVVLPLLLAAGLGGRRLLESHRLTVASTRPRLLIAFAVAAALVVALSGGVTHRVVAVAASYPARDESAAVARALALVSAGSELDLDDDLAAAAASRASLHLLPHTSTAAFVLVDTRGQAPGYANHAARDRAADGLATRRHLLWSDGRLQLWSPESAPLRGVSPG
jgi:uncharacterized membrane protein